MEKIPPKRLRCKEWLIFLSKSNVVCSCIEANSRGDRNSRRKFDESDSMFESRLGPRCLASNQNGRRSTSEHQSQRDSYSISLRVFRFSAVAAINRATRNFVRGVTFAKLSRSQLTDGTLECFSIPSNHRSSVEIVIDRGLKVFKEWTSLRTKF